MVSSSRWSWAICPGNGTYEHYVGQRGLERLGLHKWQRYVAEAVAQLIAAALPPNCRAGDNANAFPGGFRLWDKEQKQKELKHGNYNGTSQGMTAQALA